MLVLITLFTIFYFPEPVHASPVTVQGLVTILDPDHHRSSNPDNSNVVVWLTPSSASQYQDLVIPGRSSQQRFRMVQHHKRFDPHLLVIPVGSIVDFPNLDPFFHNVFSLFEGKRFDLGLYESGTTHSVRFDRPGVAYIFCNIHPEMSAVVITLDTQYYAISDRTGKILIPNVDPGRYVLSVWYESALPEALKNLHHELQISTSDPSLGTIRLTKAGNLLEPHKNKYGQDYVNPNPPGPLYGQAP